MRVVQARGTYMLGLKDWKRWYECWQKVIGKNFGQSWEPLPLELSWKMRDWKSCDSRPTEYSSLLSQL